MVVAHSIGILLVRPLLVMPKSTSCARSEVGAQGMGLCEDGETEKGGGRGGAALLGAGQAGWRRACNGSLASVGP